MNPKIIGLTGGIASGKTAFCHWLIETYSNKIKIIDTDSIARSLLEPKENAWQAVCKRYQEPYPEIIKNNLQLDKKILREIIFSDSCEKTWLENLLHPVILKTVQEEIVQIKHAPEFKSLKFIFIVIPLLNLKNRDKYFFLDQIISIETSEKKQLQRAQTRDNMTLELAQRMILNQPSQDERKAIADLIINNSYEHVADFYQFLDQEIQPILKNF